MAEVAQEGRYPYRRAGLVLENIPVELQQKYLSSKPGALLEPMPREDGFELCRVLGKSEPKMDDPVVRGRMKQSILERHFAGVTAGLIHWRISANPTE
jgi:hypothetical protein